MNERVCFSHENQKAIPIANTHPIGVDLPIKKGICCENIRVFWQSDESQMHDKKLNGN